MVDRGNGYDTISEVGARRTADLSPLEYHVLRLDVEVDSGEIADLPAEALDRPPNAIKYFSEFQQSRMAKITESHRWIADEAFGYWLRIMRWVCDDHRIGREGVEGNESGWNTRIVDSLTGHRVWASPGVFRVPGGHIVTIDEWDLAQTHLSIGVFPPVFLEFKHDAQHRFELGDYRRAVIDFAVACETFIRTTIARKLPGSLMASAVRYIDRAAIHQCMPFFADCLDAAGRSRYDALKRPIRALFDKRNALMHSGNTESLTQTECNEMLTTTKALLALESHVVP